MVGPSPAKLSEFTRRYDVPHKQVKRGQVLEHLRDIAVDRRLILLTVTKGSEIIETAVRARILNRGVGLQETRHDSVVRQMIFMNPNL